MKETVLLEEVNAWLKVDLTEPAEQISPNLYNMAAPDSAEIKSVRLVLDEDDEDVDLKRRAFNKPTIVLKGEAGIPVKHKAINGKFFTVQDLLDAVEETERQTRAQTEWFGGIDIHHVYFEGIHPPTKDVDRKEKHRGTERRVIEGLIQGPSGVVHLVDSAGIGKLYALSNLVRDAWKIAWGS